MRSITNVSARPPSGATDQQAPFARIGGRSGIAHDHVRIAQQLLGVHRRDLAGTEFVERDIGREELVDAVGHGHGLPARPDGPGLSVTPPLHLKGERVGQ